MIEGADNLDLAKIPSPCFVLDEKRLIRNLKLLKEIQEKAQIQILVALKGFAMWSTFPLLRKYLSGATASSLNEAKLVFEEYGEKAQLCSPVYSDAEIEEITNISNHITFNSLEQFSRFGQVAKKKGLRIALRINPEYSEVHPEIYNPCITGSRLGLTREQMPKMLPKSITGLHFHTMCEQNADTLARTLNVIEKKFAKYLEQISWLNIGGGHHFSRKDYDIDLFIDTVRDFKNKYDLEIIAEPGEAIGWETGYLVSTVMDIIASNGIQTAILDSSFAAHMPDTLEMPYRPSVIGSVMKAKNTHAYRLGGNTCLAGDFMGNYHFSKPLEIGDRIVFDDMIHYTMVKTNTFNGVNLPSIGIIKADGAFNLVRQFGYNDYKERLS